MKSETLLTKVAGAARRQNNQRKQSEKNHRPFPKVQGQIRKDLILAPRFQSGSAPGLASLDADRLIITGKKSQVGGALVCSNNEHNPIRGASAVGALGARNQ